MLRRNFGSRDERLLSCRGTSKHLRKPRAKLNKFLADHDIDSVPNNFVKRLYPGWDDHDVINHGFVKSWLRSNSGRKWDDVWSDICHKFKSKFHNRFKSEVYMFNEVENSSGKLYNSRGMYGRTWELRDSSLYVDSDGILRTYFTSTRYEFNRHNQSDPNVVTTADPLVKYVRIKGVWYRITFVEPDINVWRNSIDTAELCSGPSKDKWYDMLARTYLSPEHAYSVHGAYILAAEKKQLNKNEIRRLGLPHS